jgi:hypothetical protein
VRLQEIGGSLTQSKQVSPCLCTKLCLCSQAERLKMVPSDVWR